MRIKNAEIRCEKGDITKVETDVIVNAANSSLLGGSGVDGAIHRAGGPMILDECRKIVDMQGSCPVGGAVITTAGKLPSKFVIHTVGPIWNYGKNNEGEKLGECYKNSLKLADEKKLESIAFSNISTGTYGFPKEKAVKISLDEVTRYFIQNQDTTIKEVVFVCMDDENYEIYKEMIERE
jgi:O-acetyl-ADP-ribose deacetylase (regulator of RNase III)